MYRYVNCTGTLLNKCTGIEIWNEKNFTSPVHFSQVYRYRNISRQYRYTKCTGITIFPDNTGTLFTSVPIHSSVTRLMFRHLSSLLHTYHPPSQVKTKSNFFDKHLCMFILLRGMLTSPVNL
jgi:hypothetical protein